MKTLDIRIALEGLREARTTWHNARTEFLSGYEAVLSRLLFEAAANYMHVNDVAASLGVSPATVRKAMRHRGLDGRNKTLLHRQASEALMNNAAIMGIEPGEMDLMSPLAYLPMGDALKRELQDKTVSQVTELPDEPKFPETLVGYVCPIPGCNCDLDYRSNL